MSIPTAHKGLATVILVAGFLTLLAMPGVGLLFVTPAKVSFLEQRNLAQRPQRPSSWQTLRNFPQAFEKFLGDQFPFRLSLIQGYNFFMVRYLHTSPSKDVILGDADYWYYSGRYMATCSLDDGTRLLSDKRKAEILKELERRDGIARSLGVEFRFYVVPDKQAIYREYLPAFVKRLPNVDPTADLVAYVKANSSVKIHYLIEDLERAKADGKLYAQYDSHWTLIGALAGANTILRDSPGKAGDRSLRLDTFNVAFQADGGGNLLGLANLKLKLFENLPVLSAKQPPRSKDASIDRYFPVSKKYHDLLWTTKATEIHDRKLPTAVFTSDSFGNYVWPYLSEGFRRILFLRQPFFDEEVLAAERPNYLIHLRNAGSMICNGV